MRILVASTNTFPLPRMYMHIISTDRTLSQRVYPWGHHLFRVAMTKAAVKNMLRLMEAEPAGSPELDQYAHFVVQQDEIVLGDRSLDSDQPTTVSESGGRDTASNGAEDVRDGDGADASTCASNMGTPTPPLVGYGAHGDGTYQRLAEAGSSHIDMLSTAISDRRQANLHDGSGSAPPVDRDEGNVGLDVADGGKYDRSSRSHGVTGATAHPLPCSDRRRKSSDSTPPELVAGLDAIKLNVAERDEACVNEGSTRAAISEKSAVTASPIASGASVGQVVDNDSMSVARKTTISKPLVDVPARENCAQAGERDHRFSDTAQARINEGDATPHPGPEHMNVQPSPENLGVDPTHRPAATVVTTGVVATGRRDNEKTDVDGVGPGNQGICLQVEGRTPENMDTPATPGVSSEVFSTVPIATITTTVESAPEAADSSVMEPSETRPSQSPPLPSATATAVPVAAVLDRGAAPNTPAAPEISSNGNRAQASQRAQETSATDPPDPPTRPRASMDGSCSDPQAAAVSDVSDVAAVRESPSATVAVRRLSPSGEDRLENQCPVSRHNDIESATEASLSESLTHLPIRERLLRRARASADISGVSEVTGESDPDRINDCKKDDCDRLNDDGQETPVHATATEKKGEKTPVHESAKCVADQGREGCDAVNDGVSAMDDDQLPSSKNIDVSHCEQSAETINPEANSTVIQPAEEAIATPEVIDSTTTGQDGDDDTPGKARTQTVTPAVCQDLASLDVKSHRTGDGEDVPNTCADGDAEGQQSSVAVREQAVSKKEEAGLDHTNKPDTVDNPVDDRRLDDPTELEGETSGVPVVGTEGALPSKATVEDTGVKADSDPAMEKRSGGDGENEIGEGSAAEKESASPKPDSARTRDGDSNNRDGSHDEGSPAYSVANFQGESRAKTNKPRSGEGETTGGDANVGVIGEATAGEGEEPPAGAKSVCGDEAAEQAEIEPEWIEGYDPSHDCYYYHHVATGESSWFRPDAPYEPYVHSDEEEDDGVEENAVVLEGDGEDGEGVRKERKGRNGAQPSSRRTSKSDSGHSSLDRGDESTKGKYALTGRKKQKNSHDSNSRRKSEHHHERRKSGRGTNGASRRKKRSPSPTAGGSRTRSSPRIVRVPYSSENSRSNSESRSVSRSSGDSGSRRLDKTGGRSEKSKTRDSRQEADHDRQSSRTNNSATKNAGRKSSNTGRGGGSDGDNDLCHSGRRRRRKTESGAQKKSALDRLNDLTDENLRTSDSSSTGDFDVRGGRNTPRDGKHRRDDKDRRRHNNSKARGGSGSPSRRRRRSRSPGSGGGAVGGHGPSLRDEGGERFSSRWRSEFSSSSSRRYSSPSGGRRREQDRRASFSAGNVVAGSSSRREKERSSHRGSRSGDRDY